MAPLRTGGFWLEQDLASIREPWGRAKLTTQIFGFLLAVAARRFDVDLHACCVMSNQMDLAVYRRQDFA